jgi:hypothetical protein
MIPVQLGVDRIVDFTFGSGPAAVHLILEMYSQVRFCMNGCSHAGLAPSPTPLAQLARASRCCVLRALCLQGNIVLCDDKYEVLTLLRSHRDDDKVQFPHNVHGLSLALGGLNLCPLSTACPAA